MRQHWNTSSNHVNITLDSYTNDHDTSTQYTHHQKYWPTHHISNYFPQYRCCKGGSRKRKTIQTVINLNRSKSINGQPGVNRSQPEAIITSTDQQL